MHDVYSRATERSCARRLLLLGAQSFLPLQQCRMRVIKAAVDGMRGEVAEILFRKLAQRANERISFVHRITGETVRLILVAPRPGIHQWTEPEGHCARRKL